MPVSVSETELKAWVRSCLQKMKFDEERAFAAAEAVVEADLRGVDSHGIRNFAGQAKEIVAGRIRADAQPELIREGGATALYDGRGGYGVTLCITALQKAVQLSRRFGVALVTLKNSSHWGCPAYYTRQMAAAGCLGIAMTNTVPCMPLWGSKEKSVGNNPLTIAAPRQGAEPIVLDMAMQQIAWGGLHLAAEAGTTLPGLWGYDDSGRPTDDPGKIIASGRPRPMGDHKGAGLAFMLEILTGVLSTGLTCFEQADQSAAGEPACCTHTFVAIDLEHFMSLEAYFEKVEALYQRAKAAPPAEGFSKVLLPGDRSNRTLAERRRDGIPVTAFRSGAEDVAELCGIPVPW